jgi:Mitochondrial branched-chain alpha-ketoacid dehydrogenase kinase
MGLLGNTIRGQSVLKPSPVLQRLHFRQCLHTEQSTTTDATPDSELAHLLTRYSQQPPRPLTLKKLLSFGSPLNQDSLLESAEYVLAEIPRRLVGRVRALEALPFIVTTNPFLSRCLRAYRSSFEALARHPPVRDLEGNWEFTKRLEGLVADHANDIPTMAKGYVIPVYLESIQTIDTVQAFRSVPSIYHLPIYRASWIRRSARG